jgi:hypothetical protein
MSRAGHAHAIDATTEQAKTCAQCAVGASPPSHNAEAGATPSQEEKSA